MIKEYYNYGQFSDIAYYGGLDDKMNLVDSPEDVSKTGFLAFASAMWTYMTPVSPKPSMHEITTGFFKPNTYDTDVGISADFGATINVISDGSECNSGTTISDASKARAEFYSNFCELLSVTATATACNNMQAFSTQSASYFPNYWFEKGSAEN